MTTGPKDDSSERAKGNSDCILMQLQVKPLGGRAIVVPWWATWHHPKGPLDIDNKQRSIAAAAAATAAAAAMLKYVLRP